VAWTKRLISSVGGEKQLLCPADRRVQHCTGDPDRFQGSKLQKAMESYKPPRMTLGKLCLSEVVLFVARKGSRKRRRGKRVGWGKPGASEVSCKTSFCVGGVRRVR